MSSEEDILKTYRVVAIVGASANPDRPSYEVVSYLMEQGYTVIPVNPSVKEVLGKKSYASLGDIPQEMEVVDIFRKAEDVIPIVEEAIKIGAKAIWMQEGIVNQAAAAKARAAGLLVVMDKCMRKEHLQLSKHRQSI